MKTGLLALISITLILIKTANAGDGHHKKKHHKSHNKQKSQVNEVMWYEESESENRPRMFKANHKYCSSYYLCFEEDCRVQYCPLNHIWLNGDKSLGKCVPNGKQMHRCDVKTEEDKPQEFNCPKIQETGMFVNGYFGDDEDCNAYYLCINGDKFAYLCPQDSLWNDFTGSCSDKEKSPCYIESSGEGSGIDESFHEKHSHSKHDGKDHLNKEDAYSKKKENIKKSWGHVGRNPKRNVHRAVRSISLDFNDNGLINEEMLIPQSNERKSKK